MLQLDNKTAYTANLYPGYNQNNDHQLTCVIKMGFKFDAKGKLEPIESKIEETDRFGGEINQSSLVASSEIVPFKHKNEILLYGTAQIPKPNSIITEVGMRINWPENKTWHKQLRIFGTRTWKTTFLGIIPSIPEPLEPVALQYESAYGGENYNLNPIGTGFKKHSALPQIELVPKFINRITDRPIPAGFGPIPLYWRIMQTKQAQKNIYSMAPPDQQFTEPFQGGEIISIKGLVKDLPATQEAVITLPKTKPRLLLQLTNKQQDLEPICDTVIINTDEQILHLIWRVGIPWPTDHQYQGYLSLT